MATHQHASEHASQHASETHDDQHGQAGQVGADGGIAQNTPNGRSTDIHDSPMMVHLLDALEAGTDIGHFGRLTFTMIARFFLPDDQIVKLLEKQPDMNETQAKALLLEVKAHDYNPPQRIQILQWQQRQSFPICPDAEDPRACNVYDELQFPESVYDHIQQFYEQQVEAHEHEQSSGDEHGGQHDSA